MLKELQLLQEVKADTIEIFEDLQLVINQLIGLYKWKDDTLEEYFDIVSLAAVCFIIIQKEK